MNNDVHCYILEDMEASGSDQSFVKRITKFWSWKLSSENGKETLGHTGQLLYFQDVLFHINKALIKKTPTQATLYIFSSKMAF